MADTLYSDKTAVGNGISPRVQLAHSAVVGVYEIAAALAIDDLIHMVTIPAGATLLDVILAVDAQLDTDGSAALTLSVGYTGALEAIISGSTIGQGATGGVERMAVAGASGTKFAAEDTLQVSATVGAATGAAAGTITLIALYTMDP